MIPASFEYFSPRTLSEAIALLQKHGSDAKILAGGQSLIPLMKLRMASPKRLIDLNRVSGLSYIKEADGFLTIGALTRESEIDGSDLIRKKYPILSDTAAVIADPLVRNMATVGGNLAHADPANDHPATMLALGTEVVATGPKGARKIPIGEFFTDVFTTSLEPDEILTEIRIPIPPARSGGAYLKVERKVGDFATAAVAAQVTLDGNTVKRVGIGLTNVGPTPIKASRAEKALQGKPADEKNIKEAARIASEEAQPVDDLRGSADYKRSLIRVLTVRALQKAISRAKGEQ
ncbi:MAG TPA: xanthine dehydrogenase family protein subunit M [Thermoanaerobaculia bacterium]|nr:xanthine dehydrogenase family protein subunit M [Thermoanaerobaculia bacterium]